MSEIKKTPLLEALIAEANLIGNRPNPPFTAERFLVAVIDRVQGSNVNPEEIELSLCITIIRKMLGNLDAARQALMQYIDGNASQMDADGAYMMSKLQEVCRSPERPVYTPDLILAIRKDPTETIRDIMNGETTVDSSNSIVDSIQSMHNQQSESAEQTTPQEIPVQVVEEAEEDADSSGNLQAILDLLAQAEKEDDEEETVAAPTKSNLSTLVSNVKNIRTGLQGVVYGQDNAINVFATGYFQSNMLHLIDRSRRRPKATFLFAGPPGVGKTFLAEQVADALKLPFCRFDMSEYADKESHIEFAGSDKVYKNGKAGNVTSFVDKNPECVLLFDEIEKAHLGVIHLFLQILDAGRLRDNYTDKEVSFQDAIIILTTNAGRQLYENSESGDFSSVPRKVVIKALQKDINPQTGAPFFPSAICSRLASGNVVMFNHIGAHNLRAIAKKEIQRHATNLETQTGIKVKLDDDVYTALLFAEGSAADARTVRARAESFFNNELYELLRLISSDTVRTGVDDIENIRVRVDLSNSSDEIKGFFDAPGQAKILVFAAEEVVNQCRDKAPNFEIVGANTCEDAVVILKNQEIDFVMLDMHYGAPEPSLANLNLEDVESPARDFFKFLRQQRTDLPVYLIEDRGTALSDEEKVSFRRQGVRGEISVAVGKDRFSKQLEQISTALYQQGNMVKLAKANKLISFETAQTISKTGKNATITLFDFALATAVDAEDSKNILSAVSKPNVRFADVIGAKDAKQELAYFVEYLKNPKKYMGTGVKAPKGVLLYGPPGTGKTMLAKAMACEAGVTFLVAEGNQFLKRYVGEGPESVHEIFRTARKYAPSILFIDEIDAIAKERKGGANAGSNGEDALTAFLAEMDGFAADPTKPVFVLAATNFNVEPGTDKSLDPALMRRFDRRVYIDLPDKEDRIRFLKMKVEKHQALDISDAQIDNLAVRATGMSLAELDSVVELALRSAIRAGSTKVDDAILGEAFETFNSGEVKAWDPSQLERVARHEAGHALLCWLSGETPSYLTIVARGDHGGYMQHDSQEGKAIFTKEELLARIRTSLGGRAAEMIYYGEKDGLSTGASGDLASATGTAQRIVCAYGMDEEFGLSVVSGSAAVSGSLSPEVRTAVNRILNEQMTQAIGLILANKAKIDALVDVLMVKNHLNGAQINEILSK